MSSFAHHLQSQTHIRTVVGESENGELRVSYTLSGIVVANVPIQGASGWTHERGLFGVPLPELQPDYALHLEGWSPFVTLSSISNDHTATNAGWALNAFEIDTPTRPIEKRVFVAFEIAIRDIDGFINRLAYHIHLIGLEKSTR